MDLNRSTDDGVLPHLDPTRYFLLSNTAGCYNAADAVRYLIEDRPFGRVLMHVED